MACEGRYDIATAIKTDRRERVPQDAFWGSIVMRIANRFEGMLSSSVSLVSHQGVEPQGNRG